jgi:error-prone DNA polymerase
VANLIRAGALDAFGERRPLLWDLGEVDIRPDEMSLPLEAAPAELPELPPLEQTAWEYELLGLSPEGQIMRHYRAQLRAQRIASAWEVKQMQAGQYAVAAGMMAVRQRPATAKGIVFISLEDESGLLDVVAKPEVYARLRDVLRGSMLLQVEGVVQRSGRAVSLLLRNAAPLLEALEKPAAARRAQRAFF